MTTFSSTPSPPPDCPEGQEYVAFNGFDEEGDPWNLSPYAASDSGDYPIVKEVTVGPLTVKVFFSVKIKGSVTTKITMFVCRCPK